MDYIMKFRACRTGNLNYFIHYRMNSKSLPYITKVGGFSPIHIVVQYGHLELLKYLKYELIINEFKKSRWSLPLHCINCKFNRNI